MLLIHRIDPESTAVPGALSSLLRDECLATHTTIQFNDLLPQFLKEERRVNRASNEYIEKRLKETAKSRFLLRDALVLAENAEPSAANSQLIGVLKAVLNPAKISEEMGSHIAPHGVCPGWSKVTYSVQPIGFEFGFNLEIHNGRVLRGIGLIECSSSYRYTSLIELELKKLFPHIVDVLELHTLEREAFTRGHPWLSHQAHRKDLETCAEKERLTLQELRIASDDDLSRVFQPTPRGEKNPSKQALDFIEISQKLEIEKRYFGRINSTQHGYHTFAVAMRRAPQGALRTAEKSCFVLLLDARPVADEALARKLHGFFQDRFKRI